MFLGRHTISGGSYQAHNIAISHDHMCGHSCTVVSTCSDTDADVSQKQGKSYYV